MANYTGTGQVTWDQSAYEVLAYFALRAQLFVDSFADVQPTNQSMPGTAVIFNLTSDMAVQSTTINESVDVTPVQLSDSQVTVTLAEYGASVWTTAKLRGVSYLPVDPIVANVVGFNAGLSQDTIARQTMQNGSNVIYATGSARNTLIPTSTLTAAKIRQAYTALAGANVAKIGNMYAAYLHPDPVLDLRAETGAAAWRDPHTYSQPTEIWNGEVGAFEGFRFIESSNAPLFADAGSSTTLTDVYGVLCFGRQALAKAHSIRDGNGPFPKVVQGPVIDSLRRFVPMGWYWLGGYAIFRQAAIRRIECASSVGTNA